MSSQAKGSKPAKGSTSSLKRPAAAVFKKPAAKAKVSPKKKGPADTDETEEPEESEAPEAPVEAEPKPEKTEKGGKKNAGKGGKNGNGGKNEKKEKDEKKEKKGKDDKKEKDEKKEKKEKDEKKEKKEKGGNKSKAQLRAEERAKALQISDEDSGEEEAKTPEEPDEKRDTKKAWYFNKMVNQLPVEIKALWNSKDVPRRDKTAMVNASVTKENGRYALQLDNPVINAMTETFSSVVGKERLVYFISKVSRFFPRFLVVSNVLCSFFTRFCFYFSTG